MKSEHMKVKTFENARPGELPGDMTENLRPCLRCRRLLNVGEQFRSNGWTCRAYPEQIPLPYFEGNAVECPYYISRRYNFDEYGVWAVTFGAHWVRIEDPEPEEKS